MDFFLAYFLTLVIETAALWIMLRRRFGARLIARNAVVASSLTLPFVWFFFPALGLAWVPQTALAEAFAFVAEAGVYAALFPRLGLREALTASFACNCLSFCAGLALSG